MRTAILALSCATLLFAHDPVTTKLTWSQEISRLIQKRCANCHRAGGTAPMSLLTYAESRPWAKAIKEEVLSRSMPPWGAVRGFGDFANDESLTQSEITRIAEWVEGGAPEGDTQFLPGPATVEQPRPSAGRRLSRLPAKRSVILIGIRPGEDAQEDKIIATFPDGRMEPLLWLRKYRIAWNRTFVLRQPLRLPAGTKIQHRTALELLIKSGRPEP
ncbi:MAG: cytochrome c [Bryobacteraceae bacterium]